MGNLGQVVCLLLCVAVECCRWSLEEGRGGEVEVLEVAKALDALLPRQQFRGVLPSLPSPGGGEGKVS